MSWMTILSNVPWGEVITRAPAVAEGAKKLWQRVGKAQPASEAPDSLAQLQARVADLEAEMVASSELIRALAEQQAQLVGRLDGLRRTVGWLLAGLVLSVAVAAAAWLR